MRARKRVRAVTEAPSSANSVCGVPDHLSSRPLDEPATTRLRVDDPYRARILAAHHEAMQEGRDGYIDPATGLMVLTAAYLAAQGSCCDSGCRHCPYVEE